MKGRSTTLRARRLIAALVLGGSVGAGAWAAPPPQQLEVCSHTVWSILPPPACVGANLGELTGAAGELALLNATWGQTWELAGRSDDAAFGPFASNPQVSFNGMLEFDEPQSGTFVIGLVSSGKHSFYLVSSKRRIGGLGFDSLEGVATTPQGNPFPLDYAALYVVSTVPAPAGWALWLLGLSCVGVARLRAQGRSAQHPAGAV